MSTEKKLTAMQELIAYVAELKNNNDFTFAKIEDKAKELSEKEKQNIIDSVDEAISEMNLYESFRTLKNGEQYYNETFKN
jgi:hypothetical protein